MTSFRHPENPAEWPAWREALNQWKLKKQTDLKYDGSSYRSESYAWVTTDFSCCFIMMCDAAFYDYTKNEYRISSLLKEGKDEYGGYDSVVLWHAYPRIGFDDRNQFDFYRDMPQGLPGLKKVGERIP